MSEANSPLYSLRLELINKTLDLYYTDQTQAQTEYRRITDCFDPTRTRVQRNIAIAVDLNLYKPAMIEITSEVGVTTIRFDRLLGVSIIDLVAERRVLHIRDGLNDNRRPWWLDRDDESTTAAFKQELEVTPHPDKPRILPTFQIRIPNIPYTIDLNNLVEETIAADGPLTSWPSEVIDRLIILAMCLTPIRFSGPECHFIRHVLSYDRTQLAQWMHISIAKLSDIERHDAIALNGAYDHSLRLFIFDQLKDHLDPNDAIRIQAALLETLQDTHPHLRRISIRLDPTRAIYRVQVSHNGVILTEMTAPHVTPYCVGCVTLVAWHAAKEIAPILAVPPKLIDQL